MRSSEVYDLRILLRCRALGVEGANPLEYGIEAYPKGVHVQFFVCKV